MKKLNVVLTFTEEILGTGSSDPAIHETYISSQAPDAKSREEEIAAIGVEAEVEKSKTVFYRDGRGQPCLFDYQIKGFFKDACGMLARVPGTKSNKLKAYRKVIDGIVFVEPRMIPFELPANTPAASVGDCQRPLRAQTAQGERIALANSETAPAGTVLRFTVSLLDEGTEKLVLEWLDYGKWRGLGQWRNSGKGRFTFELVA